MMKINADSFRELYLKANRSFNECVLNRDNDYLSDEIDIRIDEIILVEDVIRLQFCKYETAKFLVEVKLQLLSPDNHVIGRYFYYEDEKGTPIDDVLIFD